jgi:flagellar biosynthesis/type III secretory pathway chaperone
LEIIPIGDKKMESLKHIIQTLETMIESHTRILDLAKEKRTVLVDGQISELKTLVYRESMCADEIQKLEQQRKRFVQEYMGQKGITSHSFTLEELINSQDNASTKSTLTSIAKKLRTLVEDITHINESNQQLIQTSLSYVQYSIGMHVRKEPAIGYGPNSSNRYSNLLDAKI